tara:strand:+ start:95 stop:481 length:387 start_codon:yes stop_codon:yes gene_type:complete
MTKGSVKVVNAAAEYWGEISAGERVTRDPVSWEYHRSVGALITSIAQDPLTEWYCILDPTLEYWYDGTVVDLKAGESTTISCSNLFVATGSCMVNDDIMYPHAVAAITLPSITVTALEDCIFATYYKD